MALATGEPKAVRQIVHRRPHRPRGSRPTAASSCPRYAGSAAARTYRRAYPHGPGISIPGQTSDPGPAFRADQSRVDPAAIGDPLERARFDAGEPESTFGDDDPEREGAAGQPLT